MSVGPFTRTIEEQTDAVAANATLRTIIGEASEDLTVTAVTYAPDTDITGANTNSRTVNLYNRGTDGNGTTLVATLAFVSGVDALNDDEKTITLSATAANLNVAENEILEWESLTVGTGIADPGGRVQVSYVSRYNA